MRKIILNLAMSLDGYICDEEGGYDWIVGHGDTKQDTPKQFDQASFVEHCDYIVMGYQSYLDCVVKANEKYSDKKIIVASSKTLDDYDNIHFVKEDIVGYVKTLQAQEGKDIWLYGGAKLCDHFLKADCIDAFIIGWIPTILGKGRRLFHDHYPFTRLSLQENYVMDGIVISCYSRYENKQG